MFNKAAIAFLLSAASTATTSIVANAAVADFSDVTSEPLIEDLHDPEGFDTAHIVGIEQTLIVSYENENDLVGIEEVAKKHQGSRMKGSQRYSKPRRARGAAGKGKGNGGRTASGGGGRGRNGGGRGRGRGKDGRSLEEEGDDVATIGFAVIETLASDTDIEIDELSNLPGVASIERDHEVTIDDMNLRGSGGGLGPNRHIREIMESINMGQVRQLCVHLYYMHLYYIFNATLFSFLLFRINYCTVSKTLKMSLREIFMRDMSWKLIIVTLPHILMTPLDPRLSPLVLIW